MRDLSVVLQQLQESTSITPLTYETHILFARDGHVPDPFLRHDETAREMCFHERDSFFACRERVLQMQGPGLVQRKI